MENIEVQNLVAVFLAYLLGSIPSSIWIGKVFYNIDVREHGSGNAGATNTIRTLGLKAGLPVLFIDALKGWLAVMLALYFGLNFIGNDNYYALFQVSLGVGALLGHVFPVFARFKGGKGVATILGVTIAIFPYPVLFAVLLFAIIFVVTRYVSLGSIVSAISFPFIVIFFFNIQITVLIVYSVIIAIFIPITHRKNIKRLIKGEESKLVFRNKK